MEKILIVDDSMVQAAQLKAILADEYDITIAQTPEDGLGKASSEDFSLILLDVVMPGMDGFTLLKKLQEEIVTQSIPVILITSLADAVNEQRGLVLGAVDYITKPFIPMIVKARVNTPRQAVPLPAAGGAAVHDRPAHRDRQPAQIRPLQPGKMAGGRPDAGPLFHLYVRYRPL